MTRLSPNFTLEELTQSDAADRQGINNTPPPAAVEALRGLCTSTLEPLREFVKVPILVVSGFRAPALNSAVKGRPGSQHLWGEAADLKAPAIGTEQLARAVVASGVPFDQLILEFHDPERPASGWVHLSFTMRKPLRRQALRTFNRAGEIVTEPLGW